MGKFLKDATEETTRCKENYDLQNEKEYYYFIRTIIVRSLFFPSDHRPLYESQMLTPEKQGSLHRISTQFQGIHKFPQTHGISD